MRIVKPNFEIIKDDIDDYPFIVVPITTGSETTHRRRARGHLNDLGLKKFRFKPNPFKRFIEHNGVYTEGQAFFFDFVNKAHRKTLKEIR